MTSIKKFCATLSLALVLTVSAMAGDIHGGFIEPPPSQGQQGQNTPTDNPTLETANSSESSMDPLTEGVLSVLQSVFSLF
ncbi:MAG TPA: hypothetical protein VGN95_14125 [Pyrinomonadaceae bacterium]|jgi:uncharacterized protein YdeI (BOF family)|nr:hypothetical protein [Pyrinomonadaceae bacterium]